MSTDPISMPEPPDRSYVALEDPTGESVAELFERDDNALVEQHEDSWYDRAGDAWTWPDVLAHAGKKGRRVVLLYREDDPAIAVPPEGFRIPDGLDARPVLRYTLHCSHCGKPAPAYERDDVPAVWGAGHLAKVGDYHLSDGGWKTNDGLTDPEFEGRALVCPECWQVGWCETCDSPIHVWQEWVDEPTDRTMWHRACGMPEAGQ